MCSGLKKAIFLIFIFLILLILIGCEQEKATEKEKEGFVMEKNTALTNITIINNSTANTLKAYVVVGNGVDTVTLYGQDTSTNGDFNTPYDYTIDVGASGVTGVDVGLGGFKVYDRILSNSELIKNYDAESQYYQLPPSL